MSTVANVSVSAAKEAIVAVLRQHAMKARFMTEVVVALRHNDLGKDEMEQAVAELQTEGTVIVRDNFCADPHLANVDLRVAALVASDSGADGHAKALREIDLAWNKWLGEFLANHRCG